MPPPPPPPVAPAAPVAPAVKNGHKALYDFNGQSETEISIVKDEVVEVLQKEAAGESAFTICFLLLFDSWLYAISDVVLAQGRVCKESADASALGCQSVNVQS